MIGPRGKALVALAFSMLAAHGATATGPVGDAPVPIKPCRAIDTRTPADGPALAAGEKRFLTLAPGACDIPVATAHEVVVNVTVVNPTGTGHFQIFAGDAPTPPTSVLNFTPGRTRAGNTIVKLAGDGSGTVALINNSNGTADVLIDIAGYFITACTPITVTNPGTATGIANTPFSQTFTQGGAVGAATFTTTSTLPTGLGLSTGGVLSGTPTQTGTFPITVKVTDSRPCTGTSPVYNLVINCQTITVTKPATATGTANTPFSQTFTQTGAIGTATFTTASTLPTGLSLSAAGVLSGTPTQTGTFPIVVTVTDANGCTGSSSTYSLTIGCQTITVTKPATTTGTANTPFSQTFTQSGAIGTATFTTASTLPTGLSLATNGTLSGTPTQTGTFPIVVTVTDANGCTGSSSTYSLTIGCETITVTNPGATTGTVGTPFSQTFTQSGALGGAAFTTASTLPTGLSLSTGGVLSGTPSQFGTFPIVVTATDANGCTGTGGTYSLVVSCQSMSVGPAAIPQGTANVAYPSVTFTQTGGIGSVTFSETGTLPTGMNFSAGVLSGTPTQTGTFSINVTATDSNGCTASRDYLLVVVCSGTSITISPASLPTVVAGSAFGPTQFTASGGTPSYTFSKAGALPTGMNFAVDTLSGTPTQTGTFPITISATDANGCAGSQDYVITVTCNGVTITVAPASVPAATIATPYVAVTFSATGGSSPYTFAEAGALPTGMTFSGNQLTGTPTQGGTFNFTVTATDQAGCTGATGYSLVVVCQTITVTNPGVTTGTVDAAFSQTFTQSGANGTATFTTASTLPSGLSLSTAGVLSGTPGQNGSFPIVVKVTDSNGCTGTGSTYNLVINCQTITVTKPATTTGTVDAPFSQTFTQTGVGTHTPATFTTASTLPSGLSLSTAGVLSGTPGQNGTFPIVVTVTDANGCTGTSSTYTLVIACQTITVTNPGTTTAFYTVALSPAASYTFTQSGVGTHTPANFTLNSGALPAGVSLTAAGVLTGTPTETGSFPITVKVTDANGCTGTSATYTLAVKPVAVTDTYPHNIIGNVSVNSSLIPYSVTTNDLFPAGTTISAFDALSAQGGNVGMTTSGAGIGQLTYNPKAGYFGADSFTYTLLSNGQTASATVNLAVVGMVWFINNTGGVGDGRLSSPFNTLAAFQALNNGTGTNPGPNQNIFLFESASNYTGPVTLLNGQKLIGQDALVSLSAITGLTPGVSSAAFPVMNSSNGVFTVITNGAGNTVTLGNGNTIQGLTLTGNAGALVFGGGGVTGTTNLTTVVMTPSGTANGISLTSQAAGHTFNFNSGSITSTSTGAAVLMSTASGSGPATFAVNISQSSGKPIDISSRTGGTVAFNGAVSSTGQGISLTTNTGSTINFTGGLSLSTGSNAAFTATGGGTVSATQNNTTIINALTTTTGTALNVANTTIGASGLTFRSVTANGGSNGIVLDTTGASGSLTVLGNGSAGSGGTIRNMTGADGASAGNGIYLNSTTSPSFSWMQLNDFQNFAIRGTTVSGFTLSNSVINGVNGDNANGPFNEGSVAFDELTGSVSISGTNISGGLTDNFRVSNTTGSLNRITFSSVTIGTNSTANGNAGLLLDGSGTATMNATIQNSSFTASRADLFHLNLSGGTAGGDLVFTGNTLSNNHPAIATGGGGVTIGGGNNTGGNNLTFNIANNTFRDAVGAGVLIFKSTDPGTFSGTFANNTIGVAAVANSGSSAGDGLKLQNAGLGTVTVHVTNNQIYQYNDFGMDLEAGGGASATGGALNLTITGNTVGNPGNLLGLNTQGIMLNAGTVPGDTYAICLTLGGAGSLKNSIQNSGAGASGTDFRLRQRQSTTVTLPGYGGAATDTTAVANFVIANNNVAVPGTASVNSPPGGGFVNGGPCP